MRLKPLTLGLATAALAATVGLAVTVFRSDDRGAVEAAGAKSDPSGVRAALPARLRKSRVPRFATPEPVAPPAETPPLAPPALVTAPAAPPPPPPPHAELRERATKDGFVFREAGSQAVYVVQGGTKFHIKSYEEMKALGYSWDRVEEVPPGSLGFLLDRPPEKTLLRERGDRAVFYYENGQKRHISSQETFERLGHKWSDVKVVPNGGLSSEATGSPIQ